jgi:hypothetical protein
MRTNFNAKDAKTQRTPRKEDLTTKNMKGTKGHEEKEGEP